MGLLLLSGRSGSVSNVVRNRSGLAARDRFGWNGDQVDLYNAYTCDAASVAWIKDLQAGGASTDIQDRDYSCAEVYGVCERQAVDRSKHAYLPIASLPSWFDWRNCIIHAGVTAPINAAAGGVMMTDNADYQSGSGHSLSFRLDNDNPSDRFYLYKDTIGSGIDWSEESALGTDPDTKVFQIRMVLELSGANQLIRAYAKDMVYSACADPGDGSTCYITPYAKDGGLMKNGVVDIDLDSSAKCSHSDGAFFTATHMGILGGWKNGFTGNFFISGRGIGINGLPYGWKAKLDAHAPVTSVGAPLTMYGDHWYYPGTTLQILDPDNNVITSVTPDPPAKGVGGHSEGGGIYGGDIYACS